MRRRQRQINTDTCTNACKNAARAATASSSRNEDCDDANQANNDGCNMQCQTEVNMVCQNPTILSLANRNINFNDGGATLRCDLQGWNNPGPNDWIAPNLWYRFMGAAGTRMPTSPPPELSCGTHAPGWMQGNYPAVQDGIVQRTVCYSWVGNTCNWQNPINVVNCGQYYVFQLPNVAANCWLRYCGTN